MLRDSDRTVLVRRRRLRPWHLALLVPALFGAGVAGGLAWHAWSPGTPPPMPPGQETGRAAAVNPFLPALADEADILASAPSVLEVRRFAFQPEIVVLQFATPADQARTLNRAAALIERAGFPRDRVLGNADLDRLIRAGGSSPEQLYDGHDYSAGDLLRFFAMADRDAVALTSEEQALRTEIGRWGWREGTRGALISLVRGAPSGLDQAARATILRHELSHGMFFTNADYAASAWRFWRTALTEGERAQFRAFLAGQGYDAGQEGLMVNETQAYLMHTLDDRFFNAAAVGLGQARLDALRATFLAGMPPSWLRDATPQRPGWR